MMVVTGPPACAAFRVGAVMVAVMVVTGPPAFAAFQVGAVMAAVMLAARVWEAMAAAGFFAGGKCLR